MTPQNSPAGLTAWPEMTCVTEITQSGDLCIGVDVVAELGAIQNASVAGSGVSTLWTPAVGFAMLKCVRAKIGQQVFDEFGETYLMARDELHLAEGLRHGEQVGDYGLYLRQGENGVARGDEDVLHAAQHFSSHDQKIRVHLPLFWDSFECPGNALALIALQRHKVEIEISLRARSALCIQVTEAAGGVFTKTATPVSITGGAMKSFKLVCHMVHLGETERGVRATTPETAMYITPQTQVISVANSDAGATKEVSNYFNHPVTSFQWMYRSQAAEDGNEWFQFGSYADYKSVTGATGADYQPQRVIDAISSFELLFNGYSRTSGPSEFFLSAVPMRRAARKPKRLISMYAFALDPVDRCRHTGAVNMSMIDNKLLRFTFRSLATGSGTATIAAGDQERISSLQSDGNGAAVRDPVLVPSIAGKIYLHADTVKFLRLAGGMAAQVFAN